MRPAKCWHGLSGFGLVSSAPTARANLITALKARAGLSGVQIEPAYPGANNTAQECIHLAKTVWDEEQFRLSGGTKKRERYYIEVIVQVARGGNDPATCDNRAWALVGEIESYLTQNTGGDMTIGGALNGWAELEPVDHTPGWAEGQRVSIIELRVHCTHTK